MEVDLEIPTSLHEYFRDLPPLLSHEAVGGGKKLLGTLYNQEKYIIHAENLKFVLKHGILIKKVNRVLKFRQKPFLRKYMQLNSELRALAVNKFEKNQYKLLNNCIYGKALQNNRMHVDIRLVTSWKQAQKLIAKPNFHRCVVLDDKLVVIQLNKSKVVLKHPLYVGFTVLELAKIVVFEFHYDFVKKNLQANLCYTGRRFYRFRRSFHLVIFIF